MRQLLIFLLVIGLITSVIDWIAGGSDNQAPAEAPTAAHRASPSIPPPPDPKPLHVLVGRTADTGGWRSVCSRPAAPSYCRDLGRTAYNGPGSGVAPVLREAPLGRIIGVAWRPQGLVISRTDTPVRLSPRDAFYYIIDPGDGFLPFLRQARHIAPR